MQIRIADRNSDPDALATLFSRNLTIEYISHAELQSGRALQPGKWAPNIETVLRTEIVERLRDPFDSFPRGSNWRGVVEARENGVLIGMSFVTLVCGVPIPYGVIEDIVIDKPARGSRLGEELMMWIMEGFRQAGVGRAFLESGLHNKGPHHLFERLGFKTISIVMMRDL